MSLALLAAPLAWAAKTFGAFTTSPMRNAAAPALPSAALPQLLSETGLYVAGSTSEVRPEHLFYVPQYPLWSDGATKKRWVSLPAGTRIDASDPDAWVLPIGTRFWKEFSFGERTETRYMERLADGSYRYATYVWDVALGDARLAPEMGVRNARAIAVGTLHDIPAQLDCHACHEAGGSPVLGFGALQLSSDRDPLAAHREPLAPSAVDLPELTRRNLLSGLPAALRERAPHIEAPSAVARAAAGYLFANCSSCHNGGGPLAPLGLDFAQSVLDADGHARLRATLARPSKFRVPGSDASRRALAGRPRESTVWFRMQARDPNARMPPLASKLVDDEGTQLIERWITSDL